jgi:Spy/CpxP family protein refolding chaperone
MLVVAVAVALPLLAAEKKKAAKKAPKCPAAAYCEMLLKGITVTDDQKAKLGEFQKEFGPQLAAVDKKRGTILTPEQAKAGAEARKAALAEGKKGKDLEKAVADAIKPNDEQKAKLAEVRKERGALEKALREKITSVLTAEQKEQLKKAAPKKAAK